MQAGFHCCGKKQSREVKVGIGHCAVKIEVSQGSHKPGKPGKLRELEKIVKISRKTRENSLLLWKNLENSGKM